MNRRRFLAGLGTTVGLGVAGCVGAPRAPTTTGSTAAGGVSGADTSFAESELPVRESELVRAAPRDGIPAITDPAFGEDWSGITVEGYTHLRGEYEVEPRLQPADEVIGIERDGEARAYPLKLLAEHEVVNDTFGDLPVVVATGPGDSPAANSGELFAYDRRVAGQTLTFEAAGAGRMEAGGSTWEIPTGRALSGRHEGRRLARAGGANAMFWFAWLDFHPETTVYQP